MTVGARMAVAVFAATALMSIGSCSTSHKPGATSTSHNQSETSTQKPGDTTGAKPTTITAARCLSRQDRTVVSGNLDQQYVTARSAPNHTYDLRGATSTASPFKTLYPFSFGGDTPANGACVIGGRVIGQQDRGLTWDQMKKMYDGAGLHINSATSYLVDGLRVENVEDGIDPRGTSGRFPKDGDGMVLRNLYFRYIRDDCVENDDIAGGQIVDSLFDGCNTGISERPGHGNRQLSYPAPTGETLTLDHVLLRLEDLPGPRGHSASVRGHGQLFKWSAVANKLVLRDSTFLVESRPNGGHTDFPAGTTAERVTVVWLGQGPFPGRVPPGVTITTNRSKWDLARARWLTRHGCSSAANCTRLIDPLP